MHGVVTRRELLDAGVTSDEIRQRLKNGSLLPQYRGVYRVGHTAPSLEATYLAAVRACGADAALSGKAAAFLYKLIRGPEPRPEVTTRSQKRVPGVTTRRSRTVEMVTYRGIPVTTVARTLVELASTLSLDDLARACHEAGVKYRTTPGQVEDALARRPKTKGAAKLRKILRGDTHVSLSSSSDGSSISYVANASSCQKPIGSWTAAAWTAAGRSSA